MPTGPHQCLHQIANYFKPHTQGFSLEIHPGEVTRKQPQQRLSLACDTPTVRYQCLYQILPKYV